MQSSGILLSRIVRDGLDPFASTLFFVEITLTLISYPMTMGLMMRREILVLPVRIWLNIDAMIFFYAEQSNNEAHIE